VTGLVVRAALVVVGLLVMLGGILAMANPAIGGAALVWVLMGAVIVVAVALERQRYRSEAAELSNAPAGPGGGETAGAAVEPRFQPTAEVFVDPSSGHRMRVLVDPATGERRYVAEA
jgi:disulfide bond formation protein DsbB